MGIGQKNNPHKPMVPMCGTIGRKNQWNGAGDWKDIPYFRTGLQEALWWYCSLVLYVLFVCGELPNLWSGPPVTNMDELKNHGVWCSYFSCVAFIVLPLNASTDIDYVQNDNESSDHISMSYHYIASLINGICIWIITIYLPRMLPSAS